MTVDRDRARIELEKLSLAKAGVVLLHYFPEICRAIPDAALRDITSRIYADAAELRAPTATMRAVDELIGVVRCSEGDADRVARQIQALREAVRETDLPALLVERIFSHSGSAPSCGQNSLPMLVDALRAASPSAGEQYDRSAAVSFADFAPSTQQYRSLTAVSAAAGTVSARAIVMENTERAGRRTQLECRGVVGGAVKKGYVPADVWALLCRQFGVRLISLDQDLDTGRVSAVQSRERSSQCSSRCSSRCMLSVCSLLQKFHFLLWLDAVKQASFNSLRAGRRISDRRLRTAAARRALLAEQPLRGAAKVRDGYPPLTNEQQELCDAVDDVLEETGLTYAQLAAESKLDLDVPHKTSVSHWRTGQCSEGMRQRLDSISQQLLDWFYGERAAAAAAAAAERQDDEAAEEARAEQEVAVRGRRSSRAGRQAEAAQMQQPVEQKADEKDDPAGGGRRPAVQRGGEQLAAEEEWADTEVIDLTTQEEELKRKRKRQAVQPTAAAAAAAAACMPPDDDWF